MTEVKFTDQRGQTRINTFNSEESMQKWLEKAIEDGQVVKVLEFGSDHQKIQWHSK